MVKAWHLILGIAILAFIVTIISVESASKNNQDITIGTFAPVFIIVAICGVIFAIWNMWSGSRKSRKIIDPEGIMRGGLSMAEAKFLAAKHLFSNHGIDIFTIGNAPETAKYIINLIANRCYPAAGEEVWYVRLIIRDKKYFEGFQTKIIIYLDGMGNVTDDMIMNEMTFLNDNLWRNPELHMKGISKTSKPRSFKDIITRHIQETGEIPNDFGKIQIEGNKEEKK